MESALTLLRERGCKMTPQRRAMLELFFRADAHLSAPQVLEMLEDIEPGLSRATVYNNLDLFEQEGLLSKVTCEQTGQSYFERTKEPHHHAVCESCGAIFDVPIPHDVLDALVEAAGRSLANVARVGGASVWFKGVCRECNKPTA